MAIHVQVHGAPFGIFNFDFMFHVLTVPRWSSEKGRQEFETSVLEGSIFLLRVMKSRDSQVCVFPAYHALQLHISFHRIWLIWHAENKSSSSTQTDRFLNLFQLPMAPTCALLMKKQWADKILSGAKTLELRSSNTRKRGTVGIASGGKVLGEVDIIDSFQIAFNDDHGQMHDLVPHSFAHLYPQHCVESSSQIKYQKVWAWSLANARLYDHPVDLHVKRGCIVWARMETSKEVSPPMSFKVSKKKVLKRPSVVQQ